MACGEDRPNCRATWRDLENAAGRAQISGMVYHHENPTRQAFVRGLMQRCPNCGKGHLFRAYLKQVDACADCGEKFSDIRADDGPAWATVMVVGHIVVALLLIVESTITLPIWLSISGFIVLSLVLVLALLQRAKGAFIGMIWAMGATGDDVKWSSPSV
jgi:uncharacterized protein (DUF983 family)